MSGPEQRVATAEFAGRSCPYCRFPLKEGGQIAVCSECHAAHHLDCWRDNAGCAVMGCAGAPGKGARTVAGEPTQPLPLTPPPAADRGKGQDATRVWPTAHTPEQPPPPQVSPTPGGTSRVPGLTIAVVLLALAIGGVAAALVITQKSNRRPNTIAQAAVSTVTTTTTPDTTADSTDTTSTGASANDIGQGSSSGSGSSSSPGTGPTVDASTPVTATESFYGLAASHRYADAWSLADSNFQNQLGGYSQFESAQSGDRSITFDSANVISQSDSAATVAITTTSVRSDGTQHCAGTADLAPGGQGWLLHLIDIHCT